MDMKTLLLFLLLTVSAFAQKPEFVTVYTAKSGAAYSVDKTSVIKDKDARRFTTRIEAEDTLIYNEFLINCVERTSTLRLEYGVARGIRFVIQPLVPKPVIINPTNPLQLAYNYVCGTKPPTVNLGSIASGLKLI